MNSPSNSSKGIPLYQKEFYENFYNNEKLNKFLAQSWVQKIFTLGAAEDMMSAVQQEIKNGTRVLQLGITFGPLITYIAERIGPKGQYDIIDVNPLQIQRAKSEYGIYPMLNLIQHNAENSYDKDYDAIICYNLLHELPLPAKIKVVDKALSSVCRGGKVVFVDYHRPVWYHPLRYFIRMFNRLYQPFAEKLWDIDISALSEQSNKFNWRKNTYSLRMYQKVVAIKKEEANQQAH